MIGATIVILEPALGRLLPMPLMIGWSDIPVGLVQLGVVGIVALYDRRTLGRVHPATQAVAAVVIAVRLTIYLLSMTPPVIALAERSEEHTSELQSLMRNSYAVFCLKKKNTNKT